MRARLGRRGVAVLAAAALSWSGVVLLPTAARAAVLPVALTPVELPVKASAPLTPAPAPGPGPVPGVGNPAAHGVFDPLTSRPDESRTTPTRRVFANADGSHTAQVSTRPVRFKDSLGVWRDLDLALVPDAAGVLHGRAAPATAVRVSGRSGGAVAVVPTTAGQLQVSVPGAADTAGVASGNVMRFARALQGADLTVRETVDGFEESLVLPDATGPAAHTLAFALPARASARQTPGGVEFLDAAGVVLGVLGNGIATDAASSFGGGGQETPVNSRLVSQTGQTALVSVELDPTWLAAPARVFPVTIDPTFYVSGATGAAGNADTWVMTSFSNTSQYNSNELRVGTPDGGASVARSYLRFDLTGLPQPILVNEAHVLVNNFYSYSCTPYQVGTFAAAGPFSAGTVWGNQPGMETAAPLTTSSFAHGWSASCPGGWENLDATGLVQRWSTGQTPNFGMVLGTNEAVSTGWKKFYSGNNGAGTSPQLYVTYNNLPTAPTNLTPSTGAVQATLTPALTVSASTDADNDPISYYFRVSRSADAEAGGDARNIVAESGMQPATSYTVPPGVLRDGDTYYWHVYTWDGKNYGITSTVTSFRTNLRLGAQGPSPYDSAGPVTVNLANGNLVFAPPLPSVPTVGGSLGLSLVYNSQAGPGANNTGLGRGWTLSSETAGYSGLVVSADGSITLTDSTGALSRFTTKNVLGQVPSYAPPDDMPDAVLTNNPAAGTFTLHDQDGATYVFNLYGQLLTAVSGTDDRHPAAPSMTWGIPAGVPAARLLTITDPVSQARLTLHYGFDPSTNPTSPDNTCANLALPTGTVTAPPGALCQVDYPDASTAQLFYDSTNRQLTRIVNPGQQAWAFSYDALSRLAKVREPLADEWVRAGGTSGAAARDTDATYTTMTYTGDGTNKTGAVQLADPTPLVATPNDRPAHSYSYPTGGSSTVQTAGLSSPRTVTYDSELRTLTDTDPTGVKSSSSWLDDDRPVASTDPAGRVSTTVYDSQHRATDSYGPATGSTTAGACFNAGPNGDGKPTGAAGCDSAPPHSHTDYDQGLTGLGRVSLTSG